MQEGCLTGKSSHNRGSAQYIYFVEIDITLFRKIYIWKVLYETNENFSFTAKTFDGNVNGANCAFPFIYRNVEYFTCITNDNPTNRPWCATTGNYDMDGRWGRCIVYPLGKIYLKNYSIKHMCLKNPTDIINVVLPCLLGLILLKYYVKIFNTFIHLM